MPSRIVALIALAVVVLSLEPVLAADRRSVCESDSSSRSHSSCSSSGVSAAATSKRGRTDARRVFYAAIGLAVVDIGAAIGLSPMGGDAIAFFAVLACCAWAIVRTWRGEHSYG